MQNRKRVVQEMKEENSWGTSWDGVDLRGKYFTSVSKVELKSRGMVSKPYETYAQYSVILPKDFLLGTGFFFSSIVPQGVTDFHSFVCIAAVNIRILSLKFEGSTTLRFQIFP